MLLFEALVPWRMLVLAVTTFHLCTNVLASPIPVPIPSPGLKDFLTCLTRKGGFGGGGSIKSSNDLFMSPQQVLSEGDGAFESALQGWTAIKDHLKDLTDKTLWPKGYMSTVDLNRDDASRSWLMEVTRKYVDAVKTLATKLDDLQDKSERAIKWANANNPREKISPEMRKELEEKGKTWHRLTTLLAPSEMPHEKYKSSTYLRLDQDTWTLAKKWLGKKNTDLADLSNRGGKRPRDGRRRLQGPEQQQAQDRNNHNNNDFPRNPRNQVSRANPSNKVTTVESRSQLGQTRNVRHCPNVERAGHRVNVKYKSPLRQT